MERSRDKLPPSIEAQVKRYIMKGGELPVATPQNLMEFQLVLAGFESRKSRFGGVKRARLEQIGKQLDQLLEEPRTISRDVEEIFNEESQRVGMPDSAGIQELREQGWLPDRS